MPFIALASEVAYKANFYANTIDTLNEVLLLCIPVNLFNEFPYAFQETKKIDNQSARTIAWAVMITACPSSRDLLKPCDMSPLDPEFVAMTYAIECFAASPCKETFDLAKDTLANFIHHNWLQRKTLRTFLSEYSEMSTVWNGEYPLTRFKIHMNALLDDDGVVIKAANEWRTTQLFHAMSVFKLSINGSPLPPPFDYMLPFDKKKALTELAPFKMPGRSMEGMAQCYVKNYVQYVQNLVHRDAIKALLTHCKYPDDPKMSHSEFVVLATYRVIITLADPSNKNYNKVSQLAQSFILERFYESMLRDLFKDVAKSLEPETFKADTHETVHTLWEAFPPPLVKTLVDVHTSNWGVYYMNILTGL